MRPEDERGIFKIAALTRQKGKKNISLNFIKGVNLPANAVAFTVGCFPYEIVVAGTNTTSIIRAIDKINRIGGGISAVFGEKVESIALPVAGMMSFEDIDTTAQEYAKISESFSLLLKLVQNLTNFNQVKI